ncbi:MAG: hypothetical protein KF713_19705 [Turneriella sp.]|nr:hypothetical protein [Turneriella sp.]
MLLNFFYRLRDEGLAIGTTEILDFYRAPERIRIDRVDDLFVLLKLICVRRREDADIFERLFLNYFYDLDIPAVAEGDMALIETRQFREWLRAARDRGEVPFRSYEYDLKELMKKFWDTVREQLKEHHGGTKWVGTGGASAFGHSGNATGGVRVMGAGRNFSALKVIGERRHVAYSSRQSLSGENLRQAIALLKNLKKHEAESDLDIAETVYRSGKTGDIELVFTAPLKNKLKVMLFIDNGGYSMLGHVPLTRLVFEKMTAQLKSLQTYFFHNTIYGHVYADDMRTQPVDLQQILKADADTRIFIIGDASMAPSELFSRYGNINYGEEEYEPSIERLRALRTRFPQSVWMNPVPAERWDNGYSGSTLRTIAGIFPMYDLTLDGLKKAVSKLNGSP